MNSNSVYNTFIYLSGALQLSDTSYTLVTFIKESEWKSQIQISSKGFFLPKHKNRKTLKNDKIELF